VNASFVSLFTDSSSFLLSQQLESNEKSKNCLIRHPWQAKSFAEDGEGHAVQLYVYDLSGGMAAQVSQSLLGRHIPAIWSETSHP
jgi:hypothetical protein